MTMAPTRAAAALAFTLACASPCAAQSDPVADFYKGKTVNVYIGVGVGGEYDLQARLVAKYIGRHIPGRPNVVPQNMTGASGLKMLNFLYNQAPRDGTSIGMIQNGFPAAQAIGRSGIQFDANQLRWLGTIAPVVETMALWHTAGVATIDDARKKEIIIGATARGGITYTYPALMNELLGTKFKIVTGYTGGNEINIAMERGEVQGRNNSWSSWKVTKQPWLKDKKLLVIAQAGAKANDLAAPAIEDLVKAGADRQLVDIIMSGAARPTADDHTGCAGAAARCFARRLPRGDEGPGVYRGDGEAQHRDRSGQWRGDAEDRRQCAGDAETGHRTRKAAAGLTRLRNRNRA
jgi:tripartite-type tricarboxylate transporter receptor subunit TctC